LWLCLSSYTRALFVAVLITDVTPLKLKK
jgi:hypothetical protein